MTRAIWVWIGLALIGHNASACDFRGAIRPVAASELVRAFQTVYCDDCVAIDVEKRRAKDAVSRRSERHTPDLVELLWDQAPRVTLEF